MKGAALIMFALFIDGIQAALSASLAVIAAFPGTLGGGTLGCLAGNYIAGNIGCFVLGLAGGLFGTALDAAAILTEPVGIALGFVLSICISCTFGFALVLLLGLNGMFYPKYLLPGAITEIIPGFSVLPTWFALTLACLAEKKKQEAKILLSRTASTTVTQASNPPQGSVANQPVDGIRSPANDNRVPSAQRYAA